MNEMPIEVRLELSGRITFEQDISVAQGAQVISFLQAPPELIRETSSPELPTLPPSGALVAEEAPRELPAPDEARDRRPVEGPRQALEFSGARTIPEKITAFAAYLMQEEGHETFTQNDVRGLFQRARERIPSHFTREFDKAVQAGWIHEGAAKGQFYLSQAAENVIDNRFDSLRARQSRKPDSSRSAPLGSARKKPRVVAIPDTFAGLDHIPTTLDEVIPYHQVKLKRDKLLWAVNLAKLLGIESLQSSEAAWLTNKLGDALSTRDMNGHFTGLQRRGFANRSMSDHGMRITDQGEEYLKSL
ncbi:hypothetical protein [Streptomyces chartreusis]